MSFMKYLKNVVTLSISEDRCTGCGVCLTVCPHGVLGLLQGKVYADDRDACMECGACMVNCPVAAISVQSGVGCATAVINSALGRQSSSCCCVIESPSDTPSCGQPEKKSAPSCC